MPDLPECKHSPYLNDPNIKGAALVTGIKRLCELLDPEHPDYHSGMLASYIRSTHHENGLPEPMEKNFPPITEQVGNFVKAIGGFVTSGMEVADQQLQADRLAICEACPNYVDKRCKLCGCRLHYKVKMASEHCPDNPPRW